MTMHTATTNTTAGTMHNGPVCPTCDARYLGTHQCSQTQILAKIMRLQQMLVQPSPAEVALDRTRGCPCRTENGGSGVCGCVLGGPRVTCRGA